MPKILAIDDKKDNLITISALLNDLIPEFTVVTAESGLEGLRKAEEESPDTIILDIRMPVMDGFEVCQRLKSDEKTKHIPVIMLTAVQTDSQSRIKGLEIGADAFLSKPIDKAELVAQVKVMLRIKKAEDLLRKEKRSLEDEVWKRTVALRDSEEKYRSVVENISIGISLISPNMEILALNRQMREWYPHINITENPICYRAFINPPGEDICPYCPTFKTLQEGGVYESLTNTPVGGKIRNFRIVSSPIKDQDGNIIAAIELIEDQTDRKQLEAKLQQAQKMEAIGTLAGGIAHDFNNILTPMIMHTEMGLEDLSDDSPLRFSLKEVLKAGYRASDLVRQILTFSRQSEQKRIALIISDVVKEALKLLRASLPSTIEIRKNITAETGVVLADPTQMHQVIMNLCTNAAHSMRATGGILAVSLENINIGSNDESRFQDLSPGPYIKLTVSDTGHGMDRRIVDQIFDPYFTTKEKGEGTGLGLAVVHGIVKSYGGAITVDSEPGKGATFHIFFPQIDEELKPEVESVPQLPRGTERILLVDDEKAMVDVIKPALERLGYKIDARTSSVETLEVFRNNPKAFDLVITDMTMPNMTGIDLAKELLQIRSDIPIILCTGYSEMINEKRAKEIGIRDYVMKPIVWREIAQRVRRILDNG